jgi:transposase InsO family protein
MPFYGISENGANIQLDQYGYSSFAGKPLPGSGTNGKGNCYDHSMVERFFKSIKAELIWRNRWDTRRQAEGAIFQYINGFYNPRRRHSSLGGKSSLAFERKAA